MDSLDRLRAAIKDLRSGKRLPLYVCTGEEDYFVFDAVRRLTNALVPEQERALSLHIIDPDEHQARDLRDALRARSLFVRQTTVLVKGLAGRETSNRNEMVQVLAEWMAEQEQARAEVTVITEFRGKMKAKHGLRQAAANGGLFLEFERATLSDIGSPAKDPVYGHCMAILEQAGRKMDGATFTELRKRLGQDVWALMNELDKLIAYTEGRHVITVADVRAIVAELAGERIFQLLDAVAEGRITASLELMAQMITEGTHPLVIMKLLHRRIRHLLQARVLLDQPFLRAGIPRSYGAFIKQTHPEIVQYGKGQGVSGPEWIYSLHPYPMFLLFQRVQRFSTDALLQSLVDLAELDAAIKRSGAQGGRELQDWVLKLFARSEAGRR